MNHVGKIPLTASQLSQALPPVGEEEKLLLEATLTLLGMPKHPMAVINFISLVGLPSDPHMSLRWLLLGPQQEDKTLRLGAS